MSIFREIPPTAGFPLHVTDFLSLAKRKTYKTSLEEDFKNYFNIPYAKVTCSGTAGLYFISEGLKNISHKKTVIIPSYICPSVPLAIKRAGLNVQVCDINRYDFNFNLNELEGLCSKNDDILAIVIAHLDGIPVDLDPIEKIAKQYKIFIIEDCAQALGATYKGKKVGTLGDFSFFSLARGKGLTIYEGGVVVTNKKEYIAIVDDTIRQLAQDDFLSEALKVIELFGYGIFYRPHLFWFVYKLPEIFWNLKGEKFRALTEYFTYDFPIHKVSRIRKLIGHINFYRLEKEINEQRKKASYYIRELKDIKGVKILKETAYSRATYPYLTLIFDDVDKRKKALKILGKSGMGGSEIYSLPIVDYEYIKDIIPNKDCPRGHFLAERQMTLSTSTFLKKKDLNFVLNVIKNL